MSRILVVEDSLTQTALLRFILEGDGLEVEVAPDGLAAPARLAATPFDLVLSDILMPELSGYDLCRRIKSNEKTRNTPVVLLTSLTDPLDVLRGLECGADNFLTKPVEPRYLLHRIHTTLTNAQGSAAVGTPLFFRGQGVNITADKAQILDLLMAALEEFIGVREREREARAASTALVEAGRRKDHFLAVLAHELRNPLAPLLTGLHLLRHSNDVQVKERALEAMERQGRHLSRLVDDLLDASRIAVGRMSLQRERLDLAKLVRTASEDRRAVLEQGGLTMTIAAPELPVWVHGDEARLSQVVHNLLDNSTKFTPSGGRVFVAVSREREEAFVSVTDTGVGMAPETLHRVFDVFAQAEQPLDRAQGGVWIGAGGGEGSRGKARRSGARFQPGTGARRRGRVLAAGDARPAANQSGQLINSCRAHSCLRVVVVEDNRDAANGLCLLLETMGCEVAVAYSGPEGVRIVGEHRPGLVISDIGLPGLDGYGVAAALRSDPATARTRLIALSGYGRDEDFRRAREAGFDHYLVKPASIEELQQLLADTSRTTQTEQPPETMN